MLEEEGLENVFARHDRLAEATRRAVRAWGLDYLSVNPQEHSSALTAVMMPEGHDADALRGVILERYDVSLGAGLGKVAGKVFRIGHLGWFNDLMLVATLAGGRDGLGRGRRAAPQGRRRGGDGLSRRQCPGRPRTGARRRRAMNAEGAARLLVAARRSFRPLAGLEGDLSPASDGDAYAVQEATLALLGAREAGWKVGSANPTAAAHRGAAHRRAGAEKPGALHRAARGLPRGRGGIVPARSAATCRRAPGPMATDEAWDAVASVHVAIELLDTRYADRTRHGAGGAPRRHAEQWRLLLWPGEPGRRGRFPRARGRASLIDGKEVKAAVGGNPAGHPKRLLAWLANHAASSRAAACGRA